MDRRKVVTVPDFLTGTEILRLVRSHSRNPRQSLYLLRKNGLPATYVHGRYLYPKEEAVRFITGRPTAVAC